MSVERNPSIYGRGEFEAPIYAEYQGWRYRIKAPKDELTSRLFILLHGWTGDEDSMWIFSSKLPQGSLLLSPRGLFPAPMGGYSWCGTLTKPCLEVEDFKTAVEKLHDLINGGGFNTHSGSRVSLVGFSQGAALAYVYALIYPQEVKSVAGLSGFLPEKSEALLANKPLAGFPVFMAHGSQDQLVPVEKSRAAARMFTQAGAMVHYCEDDVGHKLSATCFRSLESFFQEN